MYKFPQNATLTEHDVNLSACVMAWYGYPSTADYSYVSPDQAIGGHQETNPDVCVVGPVSTPHPGGQRFLSCANHCFSLPVTTLVRNS